MLELKRSPSEFEEDRFVWDVQFIFTSVTGLWSQKIVCNELQ